MPCAVPVRPDRPPAPFLQRGATPAVLLLVLLGLLPSALRAHPLHLTLAEADYRPTSHNLEIALRLFTDDAETVLAKWTKRKISAEKTPRAELDRVLAEYIRAHFVVRDLDGSSPKFLWIGHELKDAGQVLWVYFECQLPEGVEGVRFASRLMREEFSDQLNSVLVRDHPPPSAKNSPMRQVTLLFLDDKEQTVGFTR
jgi:hypothetical protein